MGKVISTNVADPQEIVINGKSYKTGIYKNPIEKPIFLAKDGVTDDSVIDRRVHGGEDKACYLYPVEHYEYWKNFYPDLKWQMGMFGENITTEELLELHAKIGNEYQIGEAIVQISQPRQPCFKLGYRFGTQEMVKRYRNAPYPGIYVRVIKQGFVEKGDSINLIKEIDSGITILDVYCLITKQIENQELLDKALNSKYLASSAINDLKHLSENKK